MDALKRRATTIAQGVLEDDAGALTSLEVHRRERHLEVSYFGGPDGAVMELALEVLVRSGEASGFEVMRRARWDCGQHHLDEFDAWVRHEGSHHVKELGGEICEIGCSHGGEDAITVEDLGDLVRGGEDFRSACRPQ